MPRPKIPGTETIQTFNCSYALKMGLLRSAELSKHSNPSSLIRDELELTCRRHLGDGTWEDLVKVSRDAGRLNALEKHIAGWENRRIRKLLSGRKKSVRGDSEVERIQLWAAMESYWRDFVSERDRIELPLALRMSFLEAADLVYKVSRPFRGKHSAKMISAALVLIRQLPPSIREDFEAAALNFKK